MSWTKTRGHIWLIQILTFHLLETEELKVFVIPFCGSAGHMIPMADTAVYYLLTTVSMPSTTLSYSKNPLPDPFC
ncbi:hypothetical protein L484_007226 [Morus notabilis]|uniref:Uncharacterized protein n=1 Tax=Morus notabilis TaxID=981085 RepID=W9R1Q2_9ROSA|nr:hypothetical protein L484_007226 [Morus notabilis]